MFGLINSYQDNCRRRGLNSRPSDMKAIVLSTPPRGTHSIKIYFNPLCLGIYDEDGRTCLHCLSTLQLFRKDIILETVESSPSSKDQLKILQFLKSSFIVFFNKGLFPNYVDKILASFDHLPPPLTFSTLRTLTKSGHF